MKRPYPIGKYVDAGRLVKTSTFVPFDNEFQLCKECGQNPAEKEGVCQPCLDYRSHYGI